MAEKISCFDIDGTLTREMVFIPLVDSEYKQKLLDELFYDTIRQTLGRYKSGELAYEDAVEQLITTHAQGLAGRSHIELVEHATSFLQEHHDRYFHKFGKKVVELLQPEHTLYIVTAEPQYLAEAVRQIYGFDGYVSSVYEVQDGVFTGTVERSLAHRSAKDAALIGYDIEYAFGDSEGDTEMLRRAKYPMCVNPTPDLRSVAEKHHWNIYDGDDTEAVVGGIAT